MKLHCVSNNVSFACTDQLDHSLTMSKCEALAGVVTMASIPASITLT